MEAFAGAAPAAGVFAASGAAASRPFFLRRRFGASRSAAGRVRLLRAPPPRATGDGGDLPPLDKWDMMELDFGRFLGEDPKLTLAKILVKKSDPDASSLDVEKLIATKKDKLDDILREFMDANKKDQAFKTSENVAKDIANPEQDHASANSATVSAAEDNGELEPEANGLGAKLVTENIHESSGVDDNSNAGLQPSVQTVIQEPNTAAGSVDNESATSNNFSMQAFLQGKPKRENLSAEILPSPVDEKMNATDNKNYVDDGGNVLPSKLEDITESDWTRLEHYASTGEKVEVELINCSPKGFLVSLDSLIGFLPYRNLATKWKFLAFETWLRRKGGDPSLYRQSLGLEDGFEVNDRNIEPEPSSVLEVAGEDQGSLPSKPKIEDLLRAYNQEKSKFLSSFIGQRLRVSVVLADRNSKRIFFSMKPRESEELIQKKRSLMAKLNVGDIVQCTIKRFVYFGIFVEVEGVPALIQQWEVSWDDTLDPAVSYKIGQVVDAKVIQLDYNNNRIFLSLKDVKPNPSVGALEAVIGEDLSLGGALEPVQAEIEWPEVDALMEEMRKIENVMVETTLDQERLKEAILTCTNRRHEERENLLRNHTAPTILTQYEFVPTTFPVPHIVACSAPPFVVMAAAAAFPNWAMLEPFVLRRDDSSSFPDKAKAPIRASATTSSGIPFRIAFSFADPPLVSRLYAHLPDFPDPEKYTPLAILGTHRHLVLLRVASQSSTWNTVQDFFVYSADDPSELRLLPPCTEPFVEFFRRHYSSSSVRRRRSEGEQDFAVVELKLFKPRRCTEVHADICMFRSSSSTLDAMPPAPGLTQLVDGEWDSMHVPIVHSGQDDAWEQLSSWQTDAVVPVGRWLCWIDYHGGILFLDVFGPGPTTPTVSFLGLPLVKFKFPSDHDSSKACSRLYRVVTPIHGGRALKFVHVDRNDHVGYGPLRFGGEFTITCHTLQLGSVDVLNKNTLGSLVWRKDSTVTCHELWAANPPKRLPRVILMLPLVNIDRPHVVQFLFSDFKYALKKMWVVAIDMSTNKVESFSKYVNGRDDIGTVDADLTEERSTDPWPFLPCEFSKYLSMSR
nr:unnamed protein product [Digitaria exilis]